MPLFALAPLDYAVIGTYLAAMLAIGAYAARKQRSDEEYFLASRSLPWLAVGVSMMATLMSSLTYIAEPGEVWKSGITNLIGKVTAILTEALLVLFVLIPFLMRFRFTSAYEYLGYRFGPAARRLAVALFCLLMITWLGFVVLSVARPLAYVTQGELWVVILTIGVVATISTAAGGLRGVVWTEVAQVGLMLGGCVITIGFVMLKTGTRFPDWMAASELELLRTDQPALQFFDADPYTRTSIVTFALSLFVWSLVTHVGNQMMVQRYFSLSNRRAARRSFMIAQVFHIAVAVLLTSAGLAVVYYYTAGPGLGVELPNKVDLRFPHFMRYVLPPGLTGAVFAAVLAAAMSMTDSGINALGTVLAVERRAMTYRSRPQRSFARVVTIAAGLFITTAAFVLIPVTREGNIIEMMPKTFNVFVVPMGGLFLIGMFVPWCGQRGAVAASLAGLATSFFISYAHLFGWTPIGTTGDKLGHLPISFNWVLPSTLLVMFAVAILSPLFFGSSRPEQVEGLTWGTRHRRPQIPPELIAPEVRGDG